MLLGRHLGSIAIGLVGSTILGGVQSAVAQDFGAAMFKGPSSVNLTYADDTSGITDKPQLKIGSGQGTSANFILDTGSTGIIATSNNYKPSSSAVDKGAGTQFFSSSYRYYEGEEYLDTIDLKDANGNTIATSRVQVLQVSTVSQCVSADLKTCKVIKDASVANMGVGFGRESDSQPGPALNPLLNVQQVVTTPGGALQNLPANWTPGYAVTSKGLELGLSANSTAGAAFVKLQQLSGSGPITDWQNVPALLSVNGLSGQGSALFDTGFGGLILEPPNGTGLTHGAAVPDGTNIALYLPGESQAIYQLTVDQSQAGVELQPNTTSVRGDGTKIFLNPGFRFLSLFDVFYDAKDGYYGLRSNGEGSAITPELALQGQVTLPDAFMLSVPTYLFAPTSLTVSGAAGISGTIAGPGSLTLAGGTLLVSGAATHTGGTMIANGALWVGAGGTTGSLAGDVVDNGSLVFDRSDAAAFAGAISGTGSVTQRGAGTLTLGGANSYTGGTFLDAGTITVTGAQSLGTGSLAMADGTTLAFDGSFTLPNPVIFSGSGDPTIDTRANNDGLSGGLSGASSLTKIGSGTLTLTGSNSYAGGTTVAGGTLVVDGSAANSIVTVASGGTLGGRGVIGGLVAQSGATVAPGVATPAATLSVAGNVTFLTGSTFQVGVGPNGSSDALAVGGVATLGGTMAVVAQPGTYANRTELTVLATGGGVSGSFDNVVSSLPFLTPTLTYDGGRVDLVLTRNDLTFAPLATTLNERAVARSSDVVFRLGTPVYDSLLMLASGQVSGAFDGLSGEIHASAATAAVEDSRFARSSIFNRLEDAQRTPLRGALDATASFGSLSRDLPVAAQGYAPVDGGYDPPVTAGRAPVYAAWGAGFGDFGRNGGNGNVATLNRSLGGFLLGLDSQIDWGGLSAWRIGVAGGYTNDSISLNGRGSAGTVETYFGGLYAGAQYGAVDIKLGALGGGVSENLQRSIAFPGFAESVHSTAEGSIIQGFGELGYKIVLASGFVEPLIQGAVIQVEQGSFREKGGTAALVGSGRATDVQTTTLGVRAEQALPFSSLPLIARGVLGWRHAFGDIDPVATEAFAAGGPAFTVAGAPIDRDAVYAEAGLDYRVSSAVTIGVSYDGQAGARASDNAVKALLQVAF